MVISSADSTIICTEERINQIKGSKPKNLAIIHNSPVEHYQSDNDTSLNVERTRSDYLSICYVGGLTETRFINNALNVISNNPNFKLNIAGLGPLDNIVKEKSQCVPNISYFGRVTYNDALKLYSCCEVMFAVYDPTIPNHRYSAPNKVYEAMMLGKVIIVAKGTGIDKLVEKEKMGIVINYCEKEFEAALNYIKDNPKEAIKMSNNAKKAFKSYSWNKMKLEVQKIYEKLQEI